MKMIKARNSAKSPYCKFNFFSRKICWFIQELRDQMRKLQEEKLCFVKIADKQRTELLQAFKKQCELVENLRKQVVRHFSECCKCQKKKFSSSSLLLLDPPRTW